MNALCDESSLRMNFMISVSAQTKLNGSTEHTRSSRERPRPQPRSTTRSSEREHPALQRTLPLLSHSHFCGGKQQSDVHGERAGLSRTDPDCRELLHLTLLPANRGDCIQPTAETQSISIDEATIPGFNNPHVASAPIDMAPAPNDMAPAPNDVAPTPKVPPKTTDRPQRPHAPDERRVTDVWIRDLTEEGIEPNPGPRYVSKNLDGIQGGNKFYSTMRAIRQESNKDPITAAF